MTRRPSQPQPSTLHGEDLKLWARVTATVRPRPGMSAPKPTTAGPKPAEPIAAMRMPVAAPSNKAAVARPPPAAIEPNRRHRIGRDHLEARIDLHNLTQDRARAALEGFLLRAVDDGYRAALVITGKGSRGEGVLRRRVPEWLAAPPLRNLVAGVSEAARHHGGAGALYVALKRKG